MLSDDVAGPRLAGRSAVITGASRGIGLAIAHRLVSEGARVCITGRNEAALDEAVAQFPTGSAIGVAGKVDDPAHQDAVLDSVSDAFGRLDILVNNAGINPVHGPMVDLELGAARKILDVNLVAPLAWVQKALRHPGLNFSGGTGSIINVSSVTGQVPSDGIGWYGVTKAAIAHFTRTLAVELAPSVRVNAVAPAVVKTQFSRALFEGKEEAVIAQYPLGRLGVPDDVASAVAFLASDDASWITAQVITLDGGLLSSGGSA